MIKQAISPLSKSVCGQPHVGSNPTRCAIKINSHLLVRVYFLSGWDSNLERVSDVKKMCRGHVFSREVRSSYATRTDDANEVPQHHPTRCAKKTSETLREQVQIVRTAQKRPLVGKY